MKNKSKSSSTLIVNAKEILSDVKEKQNKKKIIESQKKIIKIDFRHLQRVNQYPKNYKLVERYYKVQKEVELMK